MLISWVFIRSPGTAAFPKPVDKRKHPVWLAKKQLSMQKMKNLLAALGSSLICIVWQDRWMSPIAKWWNPPRADARLADSDPR